MTHRHLRLSFVNDGRLSFSPTAASTGATTSFAFSRSLKTRYALVIFGFKGVASSRLRGLFVAEGTLQRHAIGKGIADRHRYLFVGALGTSQEALARVNALAANGELPDAEIKAGVLKVTRLTNDVPERKPAN
jgi:hypothetical protein